MTIQPISSAQLVEVLHLSTVLAKNVLDALDAASAIPPEPAAALANAAIFLHGHFAPVPYVVMEALQALEARADDPPVARIEPPQAVVDLIASGLSRMIVRARLEASQP